MWSLDLTGLRWLKPYIVSQYVKSPFRSDELTKRASSTLKGEKRFIKNLVPSSVFTMF